MSSPHPPEGQMGSLSSPTNLQALVREAVTEVTFKLAALDKPTLIDELTTKTLTALHTSAVYELDAMSVMSHGELEEALLLVQPGIRALLRPKLTSYIKQPAPPQVPSSNQGLVMEDTLQTIEQFMAEGLQNYLSDPSVILQKLPRFTPRTNHPFFAEITAANLLAVPFNSKPDLLLHGLPVKLPPHTAIKASAMVNTSPLSTNKMEDVDEVKKVDDEMHKLRAPTRRILELTMRLEMSAFPMKVMTLMGVSGCGKTRTLLEVASMQFGLYFVVNNMGNGGSPDMAAMLGMLDIALRGVSDPDEAESIGECHLYALLLSRLLVLQYLRKHTQNKKDLPFYWLLLQYRPNMLLPQGAGGDFFSSVFRSVVKCGRAEIVKKLDTLLQEFHEAENTSLYIFSDESQELFTKCENKFKGPTTGGLRSAFSKLVNTWASCNHAVLVLAGTGLRLRDSIALVASAVFKSGADMQNLLIADFDMYEQPESMQAYFTQFFPVSPPLMDYIFSILTGRTRSSALFVIQVLINQSIHSGENILRECITEVIDIAASQTYENSPMSLRRELKKLQDGTRPDLTSDAQSRLGIIRVLTMCYYYFGKDYVFTSQRALQLVEHGVCPLKYRSGNELVTHIAEPLVAWTAYKFFEDIGNPIEVGVLQQMGTFRILPSSLGLLVERFLIPAIVAYFTKDGVSLDQTEYFQRVFEVQFKRNEMPDWIIGATLDVENFRTVPAATWIQNASSNKTILEFLTAESSSCVFCPEPHLRKDAIVRLKTQYGPRLSFVEFKFRKALSVTECTAAIDTTQYNVVAQTMKRKYSELIAAQEKIFNANKGTLRIIFLYPAAPEKVESMVKPNGDVIVILDQNFSRELLSQDVWCMFGALKSKCDEVDKE